MNVPDGLIFPGITNRNRIKQSFPNPTKRSDQPKAFNPQSLARTMDGDLVQFCALLFNSSPHAENYTPERNLREMGFKYENYNDWPRIFELNKVERKSKLLNHIVKHKLLPDVIIRIGKTDFHCHFVALCCYSTYFNRFMDRDVIHLPEKVVSPKIFRIIYDWILADKPVIQNETLKELKEAARYLKIPQLLRQVGQCWYWNRRHRLMVYRNSNDLLKYNFHEFIEVSPEQWH